MVAKLAARDREVRAHEAAHAALAGGLAVGGPRFDYQTGPDGKMYAIGGEVRLNITQGRTPEETIARARQIRAAALAPGDPSTSDLAVAISAARMEDEARQSRAAEAAALTISSSAQLARQPVANSGGASSK